MGLAGKVINRRQFLRLAAGGTVVAGAGAWHSLVYSPTHPEITRRTEGLWGIPDAFRGYRVVQLSDLHFSEMVSRAYLEKCVAMTNALEPDLIVLTGDYLSIDRSRPRQEVLHEYGTGLSQILGQLRARDGVVAVLGNHDTHIGSRDVSALIERAGIPVLRDEVRFLQRGQDRLALVGLADYGTQHVRQRVAFGDLPPDEPALILMHNPDLFELGMRHRNGLVFAGHTHGGQMLFPFVGALYVPSRFGDKYLKGRFQNGHLAMIVNRGLGMIRIPARLNCPPEIALVTLA